MTARGRRCASEGGLLAGAAVAPDAPPRRAAGRYAARVLAAIREGYEQHYGEGRVMRTEDRDLALLAGDRLYALGLARLAELGDLRAVADARRPDLGVRQAHAEGDPRRARGGLGGRADAAALRGAD